MRKEIPEKHLENDLYAFICWRAKTFLTRIQHDKAIRAKYAVDLKSVRHLLARFVTVRKDNISVKDYGQLFGEVRTVNELYTFPKDVIRSIGGVAKYKKLLNKLVMEGKVEVSKHGSIIWMKKSTDNTDSTDEPHRQNFTIKYWPKDEAIRDFNVDVNSERCSLSKRLKNILGKDKTKKLLKLGKLTKEDKEMLRIEKTTQKIMYAITEVHNKNKAICKLFDELKELEAKHKELYDKAVSDCGGLIGKEQYEKEFAEGKHLLDYEQYISSCNKQKATAEKAAVTKKQNQIVKANKKVADCIADLTTKNKSLEAKNKSLEAEVHSLREQNTLLSRQLADAENKITNGQDLVQQAVEICQNQKLNEQCSNGDKVTVDNILDTRGSYNLDLSHDIESDEHLNHKVKVSTEAEQAEQRHQELMRKQAELNAEYEKRWRAESARMKAEHEANVKAEEEAKLHPVAPKTQAEIDADYNATIAQLYKDLGHEII